MTTFTDVKAEVIKFVLKVKAKGGEEEEQGESRQQQRRRRGGGRAVNINIYYRQISTIIEFICIALVDYKRIPMHLIRKRNEVLRIVDVFVYGWL